MPHLSRWREGRHVFVCVCMCVCVCVCVQAAELRSFVQASPLHRQVLCRDRGTHTHTHTHTHIYTHTLPCAFVHTNTLKHTRLGAWVYNQNHTISVRHLQDSTGCAQTYGSPTGRWPGERHGWNFVQSPLCETLPMFQVRAHSGRVGLGSGLAHVGVP